MSGEGPAPVNDHGWKSLDGFVSGVTIGGVDMAPGTVEFADLAPERVRCACPRRACARRATQEDLLCDQCRKECP